MVARLPLDEREVIALHYLEGYSYEEIARIVGAPLTTVKYRLAAARAARTQAKLFAAYTLIVNAL